MATDDPLARLLEVSADVTAAVVFDEEGDVVAATLGAGRAAAIADAAGGMLAYAAALRPSVSVDRIEAVTRGSGVYVIRHGDRAIVATTGPKPFAPLVRHDLRECLASFADRPSTEGDGAAP